MRRFNDHFLTGDELGQDEGILSKLEGLGLCNAIESGTYLTYTSKGNRESLSDIIYNISPTETPCLMMFGRERAKATFEEWQTDELTAAVDTNAKIEGDQASFSTPTATVRVGNHLQISDKTIIVSGTQEVIDKAGRKSELAYQLSLRAKELKRDMEKQICGNKPSVAGDATTARQSGSLRAWIATNDDFGATGASGGYNTGTKIVDAATDGTQRGFLESAMKQVISDCWNAGGDPTVVMVGPFNKRIASGFTGNSTRQDKGEDKRVTAATDVYVSDFGDHKFVPNRFSRERDAHILTPRLWAVRYLRSFKQHAISKLGDAEKRQLLVEYTLCSKNEKGSGGVYDLNTS